MCQILRNKPHLLPFLHFDDVQLQHDQCLKPTAPRNNEILLFFNGHEVRAVWDLHPNSWSRLNKTLPTWLSVAGEITGKTLGSKQQIQAPLCQYSTTLRSGRAEGLVARLQLLHVQQKCFHLLAEESTSCKSSFSFKKKSLTVGSTINTFNRKLILPSRTTCQSLFIPHLLTLLIPKSQVVSRLRKPQHIKVCRSRIFSHSERLPAEPHFMWRNPRAYIHSWNIHNCRILCCTSCITFIYVFGLVCVALRVFFFFKVCKRGTE